MREYKKAEMTMSTIIYLVIGVIILIALLFFIFNPYVYDWIRNLPGYKYNDSDVLITNLTKDELASMGCSVIIARIGALEGSWGSREQYFYIEGKKSDLYFDSDKIFLDVTGKDIEIGIIGNDNKIIIYEPFMDEKSQEFINNRERGLPKIEIMKLLHGSFKLSVGNYICRPDKKIEEGKQCNQECMIFDGNCRKNGCFAEEVSYGQLNCENSQLCCVSSNTEKIENGKMTLSVFKTREKDFLKETKISPVYGLEGLQVISLNAKYDSSFCYVVRTNENVLKKSFDDISKNEDDIRIMPVSWIALANEKTLELRIWDLKDKDKKVGKRLLIEGQKLPENYEPGEIIKDNELKSKIENSEAGYVFYILGLRFDWSKKGGYTYSYADYMVWISKEGVVKIYVYGVYPAKKDEWHLLDCYGGLGSSIYIKNLKQSLTETLSESCSWS